MALAKYTNVNVTNTKQFAKACSQVFGGIKQRNEQVQQLLILAVNEAAKESGGQVANNLTWLSELLKYAHDTNGINFTKVVRYVKEVLCCNTIAWSDTKKQVVKSSVKGVVLTYNTQPDTEWYNYGKKPSIAAAFDYGKRVTSAINSAMKEDKGGLSSKEVIDAILQSDGLNLNDLLEAAADYQASNANTDKPVDDNPAFDNVAA